MPTIIRKLSKEETRSFLKLNKIINQVPKDVLAKLKKDGWKVAYDYSIEKKYKGYFLVIEFCIGDFCTSICSKRGHWLLEPKIQNKDFIQALVSITKYQMRIDKGEHWTGEDD